MTISNPPPNSTGPNAETEAHLLALEDGAMERWRRGDPWGWVEISAPTVTYIDPSLDEPVVGLDALKDYYAQLEGKIIYEGSEYLRPHVQIYGATAVLSYRYISTERDSEGNVAGCTRWNCTEVYTRLDDQWKIIHTHWSYIGGRKPEE